MNQGRRQLLKALLATTIAIHGLLLPTSARPAQTDWPKSMITFVVPYAAGSLTDITARIYTNKISELIGQPILIENRPGAATVIGMRRGASAKPDGYTFTMTGATTVATGLTINPDAGYKLDDFVSVGTTGVSNLIFSVNPSVPVKSVKEFIAYAKANPNQIMYSSTGPGSIGHLAGALFSRMAGIQLQHVPYKDTQQATLDIVAGRIHMQISTMTQQVPFIKEGKLRGLGVASLKPEATMPEIPTIESSGLPGYVITSTLGILAPAGTPREIVEKLNNAVNKVSTDPTVRARLEIQGIHAEPGPPEEFMNIIKAEIAKFSPVIEQFQIRVDP